MARLTPRFSTNRAVCEYTERRYLPAAAAYRERCAGQGQPGVDIAGWRQELERKWTAVRFGEVKVVPGGVQHAFEAQVHLGGIDPEALRVELYADSALGGTPERREMKRLRPLDGAPGGYVYAAAVPAARPPTDYTARVIAHRPGVAVPLEAAPILWQR